MLNIDESYLKPVNIESKSAIVHLNNNKFSRINTWNDFIYVKTQKEVYFIWNVFDNVTSTFQVNVVVIESSIKVLIENFEFKNSFDPTLSYLPLSVISLRLPLSSNVSINNLISSGN